MVTPLYGSAQYGSASFPSIGHYPVLLADQASYKPNMYNLKLHYLFEQGRKSFKAITSVTIRRRFTDDYNYVQ